MLGQYLCIRFRFPTLASTFCLLLCLSFVRISLFIYASWYFHLTTSSTGMDGFWAWRSWAVNINQVSSTSLASRPWYHGTLSSRPMKRAKSALLNSKAVVSHFTLFPPLINLNSTILWTLQSRLPLTFTSPVSPSLCVSRWSSRAPLFVGSSVTWIRKFSSGSSWIAYALLCCSYDRYQAGWSSPWESGPVNGRLH